jgi:hypothetical protein
MKKRMMLLIMLLYLTACQQKTAVIKIVEEPLVIETSKEPFHKDMIFDYVTVEDTSGKVLDTSSLLEVEGRVNLAKVGTYTLQLKVNYNGKIVEKELVVHVEDTIAPIIYFVDPEILVLADETEKVLLDSLLLSAYDYYDGVITSRMTYTGDLDRTKEGLYRVTFAVSDTSGNRTEKVINVRVTNSMEEYGRYLYDAVTRIYWGDYYLQDEKLDSVKGLVYVNHEDLMEAIFTDEARETFEACANPFENSEFVGCGVSFIEDQGYYYKQENHHQNRLNYKETILVLKSRSDDSIVFEAVSYYSSSSGEYTEKKAFVLVKVDGKWKVEEYTFPH